MPKQIFRDEVRELVAKGAQLVDVLPVADFEAVHIPGSINLPIKELDAKSAQVLSRDRAVICYCYDFQ
jgi:rhodanese-related sulfurtransferase